MAQGGGPRALGELTATDAGERERTAWAAAVLAAVAVLKGLRPPNLWAATQAQIDYSLGFVKRGLFGELARLAGLPIGHYTAFGYLSLVLLLAALALAVWFLRASGAFRLLDGGSLVALFAASFGVTYLAHLTGYLDIPLLCLALAALLIRAPATRLAAAAAATGIGILMHESFLLAFFPLLALPLFLAFLDRPRAHEAASLALLVLFAAALALIVALERPLSADDLAALRQSVAARVDFPPRADVFEVLNRSAGDNLRIMAAIMRRGYWWRDHLVAGLTALPTIAVCLWAATHFLRANYTGARRRLAVAAALMAGLSPLLLQFVGWDLYRWYALAIVTSFLTLVVAARACGQVAPLRLPPAGRVAIALLIGLNMASGEGLMNGQRVAVFPFKDYAPLVQGILAHGGRLPVPAE